MSNDVQQSTLWAGHLASGVAARSMRLTRAGRAVRRCYAFPGGRTIVSRDGDPDADDGGDDRLRRYGHNTGRNRRFQHRDRRRDGLICRPNGNARRPGCDNRPGAPTPQRVLYLRFNYPEQRDELRSVAVDGSDDRVIWACVAACDITGLALSPDGNSLAFTVRGPREPEALFIADVEVKNFVTLPGSAALTPQTWSADGEWLAFAGERSADPAPVGERSIWIVNRAGDSSTQLTPWAFFVGPPLWLDDQHLLFSRAATGTPPTGWQIYRVDTAGNMQIERMADGEIVEASPDRTSVLAMVETIPNDPVHRALTLIPLDGGEPRRIAENLNPNATWAPDGKSFVYFNPQSSSIVQVQADDGSATDLWTIEDIGNFPFVQLAWDPRGAYLFFSVTGTGTTELRRLDMEARTVQTLLSYE
ncbi:MAG TPA: hypothetical protein VEZ12_12525, partial [Herpetosiphonaceae bacterium]|nr:hypothetical protein [Herpetosiphonaceae bacterium]